MTEMRLQVDWAHVGNLVMWVYGSGLVIPLAVWVTQVGGRTKISLPPSRAEWRRRSLRALAACLLSWVLVAIWVRDAFRS